MANEKITSTDSSYDKELEKSRLHNLIFYLLGITDEIVIHICINNIKF
jgi:phenolic acid decarboxylase